MKKLIFAVTALCLCTALFAGGSKESNPAPKSSEGPVTIKNGLRTVTVNAAPQRAVVLGYEKVAILCALGVEKNIAGYAPLSSPITDAMPAYRETIRTLPVLANLAEGHPKTESVLAENPDLVYAPEMYFSSTGIGTPEDYEKYNIPTYMCNCFSAKYRESKPKTLEDLYDEIRHMGSIFRVEKKAEEVVASLKKREEAVKKAVPNAAPPSVFVFSGGKSSVRTTGNKSIESYIIKTAGGHNIFEDIDGGMLGRTSWEAVIDRNPEVIIIHTGTVISDAKTGIELLKSKKELSEISAIKNNRFFAIPFTKVAAGLENLDYLEDLARFLHPEK
jgi:hypothetical protein